MGPVDMNRKKCQGAKFSVLSSLFFESHLQCPSLPLSSYILKCQFLQADGRRAKQGLAPKEMWFIQTSVLPYYQWDQQSKTFRNN